MMFVRADLPADPTVRRILIIKWSAMGDVMIATALFEDIARAFKGRELHLNTSPAWEQLFVGDSRFQRVFAVDFRNSPRPFAPLREWLLRVRRARYDLIIDLQSNDRSRLLLALLRLGGARIPHLIGINRRWPYNLVPETDFPRSTPILTRMRAALNAGGIPTETDRPVLQIPERHQARARQLLAAHQLAPGRYAIFLAGCSAGGRLKRWGAARYAALAERLHQQGLDRMVLIGGPDDMEECRQIAERCGAWLVNLCGQTAILDIPALCESACFIVANDTGTAHLAALTTTPMTVICGPTDPVRVKPLGENVTALQADLPCVNCYLKTCSHQTCMKMITPARVLRHLQQTVRWPA
ncbi:MAG TPA: glycosyltransferase family 9 protein [Candidatus Competibacter sp.]|nr:glycosyltransferase family 9 protein [Candidatus Competibacteraceae bacterium]HRE55246.1 glycosyltransferase family 9 protein [Candidatus Competibacter sp.]